MRAGHRCEYCLIYEQDAGFPHQVDHIVSRKHSGSSTADNLALACIICNRYKGSDVASINPGSGQVVRLFHPRHDQWADHFRIQAEVIEALTEVGTRIRDSEPRGQTRSKISDKQKAQNGKFCASVSPG